MVKSSVSGIQSGFPKMMVAGDGEVVMFSAPDVGMVLVPGKSYSESNPVGYYHDSWDMSYFSDFSGKVTLSNED